MLGATASGVAVVELVIAVAVASIGSALTGVSAVLLARRGLGNAAGNGLARGEYGGPRRTSLGASAVPAVAGAARVESVVTCELAGGARTVAATTLLAGALWRSAGKSDPSQSSKTGFRQLGQLLLPLREIGESHFKMQFMPNMCPQASLIGTSGFLPRRKASEQMVQFMLLPSSEATRQWVLARNSLSRTAVWALRCSFWASSWSWNEFGAGVRVGACAEV